MKVLSILEDVQNEEGGLDEGEDKLLDYVIDSLRSSGKKVFN